LAIFKVLDPFQDLLPRGSSIAIGAFQFIDLRLEAPRLNYHPVSARERQKAFGACLRISPILGASTALSENLWCRIDRVEKFVEGILPAPGWLSELPL
jgi:hypothetical protein